MPTAAFAASTPLRPLALSHAKAQHASQSSQGRCAHRPHVCALTGGDRRALRSEAGRREAAGTLAYVRMPRTDEPLTSECPVVREVRNRLRREEIVRVKTAEKKKKLAAAVGDALAAACDAEIAQVIGHTVLIYRPAPSGATLAEGVSRITLEEAV
jgi:RNA-binding protein YhbY